MRSIGSALIWTAVAFTILFWLPVLAVIRVFDRDPAHYYTGKWFRKLGKAITRVNPNWKVSIEGNTRFDDRKPYVMICNHLSHADIPVISNLGCEMKWVAKQELFKTPVTGWMMQMAGDIAVDRKSPARGAMVFKKSSEYLEKKCSVMFFPEGTRSRDGRMNRFAKGAFELAVRTNTDILPMVIDGTRECLPKNTWKFGKADQIKLKVLNSISTKGLTKEDVPELIDTVRSIMVKELAEMRGKPVEEVDGLIRSTKATKS